MNAVVVVGVPAVKVALVEPIGIVVAVKVCLHAHNKLMKASHQMDNIHYNGRRRP
jgi:hypothetical protein